MARMEQQEEEELHAQHNNEDLLQEHNNSHKLCIYLLIKIVACQLLQMRVALVTIALAAAVHVVIVIPCEY